MSTTTTSDLRSIEGVTKDDVENTPASILKVIESLTDEVRALKDDLNDYKEFVGKEMADVRSNVHSIKESTDGGTSSDQNPKGTEGESAGNATPLEQIAALDKETAEENLTTNQRRARMVAKNVKSISKKCPKGRVITSTDIRKAIALDEGETPHTETVSRVIRFLQRFDDRISVVKRRGKRRVVFSEELTHSLERSHGGCDPSNVEGGRKPVILAG